MKIKKIHEDAFWVVFLAIYPIVATMFLYYFLLKHSGYAGMVLIPLTGLFLIGSFIANIATVSIMTKNAFPFSIYTIPVFTPIVSALFLLKALLDQ